MTGQAEAEQRLARRSLWSLDALNLFVAQLQTGFGAFLSVYLAAHMWTATDIGFALSLGTIAVMIAQVPAGALVDAVPSKRAAAAVAIAAISVAALIVALRPEPEAVFAAEMLQGVATCVLTPAIAAITLALTRPDVLGERLGNNVRFAAIGSFLAAGIMGAVGYWFSHRTIFYLAAGAGVAAIAALAGMHGADLATAPARTDHPGGLSPRQRARRPDPIRLLLRQRALLVFAGAMALFQLGNAAILPIAATAVTRSGFHAADFIVSAAIIVPQALAAIMSPWMGARAQRWGRRPVLLLGLAAMPLRAMLFAADGNPYLLVGFQALDGITAAVLGMIAPLIVADVTRRTGRFNLGMGVVGLAVGLGASLSTSVAGAVADRFGNAGAFLALSLPGVAACVVIARLFPETARAAPVRA